MSAFLVSSIQTLRPGSLLASFTTQIIFSRSVKIQSYFDPRDRMLMIVPYDLNTEDRKNTRSVTRTSERSAVSDSFSNGNSDCDLCHTPSLTLS